MVREAPFGVLSPPPPLPVPSLGAAPPDPPCRPERPRPQTPDGLKVPAFEERGFGSRPRGLRVACMYFAQM
ncbi:hypothetical protein E4K73_21840 [Streptomyces sp. IB201691-2A2]|nr:hypothetical protein E4K73_21840 [Streptomyces sp. IB201691-2A2]